MTHTTLSIKMQYSMKRENAFMKNNKCGIFSSCLGYKTRGMYA